MLVSPALAASWKVMLAMPLQKSKEPRHTVFSIGRPVGDAVEPVGHGSARRVGRGRSAPLDGIAGRLVLRRQDERRMVGQVGQRVEADGAPPVSLEPTPERYVTSRSCCSLIGMTRHSTATTRWPRSYGERFAPTRCRRSSSCSSSPLHLRGSAYTPERSRPGAERPVLLAASTRTGPPTSPPFGRLCPG